MVVLFLTLAACRPPASPPPADTSTRDSGAESGGESAADTAGDTGCEAGTVQPVDECAGRLGSEVPTRLLVDGSPDGTATTGVFEVFRSQAELDSFWSTSGMAASGAAVPTVDFTTEQVVVWARNEITCDGHEVLRGFYVDAADPAKIVASVERAYACSGCDTGPVYVIDVWATPVAELGDCRFGEECCR